MFTRALLLLGCFALASMINACGVKPSTLKPPEHVQNDTFPRTYPAPEHNDK